MAEKKKTAEIAALRKLTTKTIMGERVFRPEEKERYLYRIAGTASGTRTGQTDYGTWIAFIGNFTARRHDGKLYASPRAILPQPMQDMLEAQISISLADGLAAAVSFAVDIFIIQSDSSIGYEYLSRPVLEAQNDAMSLLEASFEKVPLPKGLPAPEKK